MRALVLEPVDLEIDKRVERVAEDEGVRSPFVSNSGRGSHAVVVTRVDFDGVEVYPGHNYGVRPSSTIGDERRTNPFLLRETFESFLDLKIHWLEYKKEHGIL